MNSGILELMEFDVTLSEQDMIGFNLYHTYSKFSSWFAIVVAVLAFVVAAKTYGTVSGTLTAVYIVIGVFILIYIPLNTVLSAKRRIRLMPEIVEPLHYRIDDEGITVSKEGEAATLGWNEVFKAVFRKDAVYIYSSRIHAYVIPYSSLKGEVDGLKELCSRNLESRRVKL